MRLFEEALQAAGVADRQLLQRVTDSDHFKRRKGSRSPIRAPVRVVR